MGGGTLLHTCTSILHVSLSHALSFPIKYLPFTRDKGAHTDRCTRYRKKERRSFSWGQTQVYRAFSVTPSPVLCAALKIRHEEPVGNRKSQDEFVSFVCYIIYNKVKHWIPLYSTGDLHFAAQVILYVLHINEYMFTAILSVYDCVSVHTVQSVSTDWVRSLCC